MPNFRDQLEQYLRREASPAHKYSHQPRLYALTKQIAALTPSLSYDDDIVFAAAFLHDLGVFVGHRPEDPEALKQWNHVPYTCERAPQILADINFPTAKISAVLACIRKHQPHDDPQTIEATILRDADILEQLGAIGALRALVKVGRDTRYRSYSDVIPVLEKAARELPAKLRTDAGRKLAEPRIAALQALLASIAQEAGKLLH